MKVVLLFALVAYVALECCIAKKSLSKLDKNSLSKLGCCTGYPKHCNFFCCNCTLPCACKNDWCTAKFCKKRSIFGEDGDGSGVKPSIIFNKADDDNDGKLSTSEVQKALKRSVDDDFTADFKTMDLNNDGFIQPVEFDTNFY